MDAAAVGDSTNASDDSPFTSLPGLEADDSWHSPYPVAVQIIVWLVVTVLSLETIIGNAMVIMAYKIERNISKQVNNRYIVSLALSDLIIGIEGFPLFTVYFLNGDRWPLGTVACETWLFLDYTLCLVSILTVLLITADRYLSVCHTAKYLKWQSIAKTEIAIVLSWVIPAAVFGIMIYGWSALSGEDEGTTSGGQCSAPFLTNPYVNMGMYVSYYWTTLVAMLILYKGIHQAAKNLEKKARAKERRHIALILSQQLGTQVGVSLMLQSARNEELRRKREEQQKAKEEETAAQGGGEEGNRDARTSTPFLEAATTSTSLNVAVAASSAGTSIVESSSTLLQVQDEIVLERNEAALSAIREESATPAVTPQQQNPPQFPKIDDHRPKARVRWASVRIPSSSSKDGLCKIRPARSVTSVDDIFDGEKSRTSSSEITTNADIYSPIRRAFSDSIADWWADSSLTTLLKLPQNLGDSVGAVSSQGSIFQSTTLGAPSPMVARKQQSIRRSIVQLRRSIRNQRASFKQPTMERAEVHRLPKMGNGLKTTASVKSVRSVKSVKSSNLAANDVELPAITASHGGEHNNRTPSRPSSDQSQVAIPVLASSQPSAGAWFRRIFRRATKHIETRKRKMSRMPRSRSCSLSSSSSSDEHQQKGQQPVGNRKPTIGGEQRNLLSPPGGASPQPNSGSGLMVPDVGSIRKGSALSNTRDRMMSAVFAPIALLGKKRKQTRAERRAHKAFRTITFIVGLFAVLWSPYYIMATLYGFCRGACIPHLLYTLSYYMCYLNSSGNPFAYALANRQFRSTFQRMLRGDFSKVA